MSFHILPIDTVFTQAEIMGDVRDLLRRTGVPRDLLVAEIVENLEAFHCKEVGETEQVVTLIMRRLYMLVGTAEENRLDVSTVDAFAEILFNSLWPFLQQLGYHDGHLPQLRFIRLVGEEAIYVED